MLRTSICGFGLLIAESSKKDNESRGHGAIVVLKHNATHFVELLLLFEILLVIVE